MVSFKLGKGIEKDVFRLVNRLNFLSEMMMFFV